MRKKESSLGGNMARMGLRAPVNVTWEITLKCNLQCVHCLSDAGTALKEELTTGECRALVDQLTSLRVFQVNIGGGEPFIRDDFLDILAYAHEKGLVTCVSTNGMVVDDRLARKLSQLQDALSPGEPGRGHGGSKRSHTRRRNL